MPKKVRGPDGRIYQFPDEATDDQIRKELNVRLEQGPSLMDPQPTLLEKAAGWLPSIGGTVGGIAGGGLGSFEGVVGGIPGAVGGAAVGGGAGEALRQIADRLLGVQTPTGPKQIAKEIAVEGGTQGALELGGGLVAKGVGAAAKSVYRGYLKPSLAKVNIAKAREIVDTALEYALPVSKAGEERAGRLINGINGKVNDLLQHARGMVDIHRVADAVRTFAKQEYYRPGVNDADFTAAMEVADTIDKHPSLGIPAHVNPTRIDVPATQANDIKQAVRPNSRAYGQQGSAPEAATRKVAGSEMRQAIEGVEPAVGPLNDAERRLIDAQDSIRHAAGREENRNALFGVPNLLSGAIGSEEYARTRDPASSIAYAMAARAALNPAVATQIAIKAVQLSKNGYTAAAAARLAYKAITGAEFGSEPKE